MNARENLIVVGTGTIGTGKSRLLWDRYVRHHPRVIHIDENDEVCEYNPNAIRALGSSQLFDYLAVAQRKGAQRFNIAAVGLDNDEIAQLFRVLAPRAGTFPPSLARAFGTLAVECGEVGALCQASGDISDALGAAAMKGRHSGLSLFLATQYPYSLPPVIRTCVHEVFFFAPGPEPRALLWVKEAIGVKGADVVRGLNNHSFVLCHRATGTLYLCNKHHHVIREIRPEAVEPSAPPLRAPTPPRTP